ncbi:MULTISPECIES: nuclear transport factor 2 family protein [Burkholderia]|uniref:nuclear transport factor 2 family protein n=1 Tax=Burkholderia TaxID=32008 RepID=UPI001423534A|nr:MULTISPECIES: nuclear transport factor 2 family protein [Burkholderia]NIE84936.1 nuclear transport factor 2 family protein [Burkholderia sp. Tr-860]NIF63657.1 nuclear transport factor 2 family protein [Burkholderia sp. Cy-647]NIF95502.1 nuclear transport factor 2 family protein [Burkholderia sp. Ax-1720]
MTTAVEIVQNFYAALERGDAPQALALMADDIEWTTMWHYQVKERGPQAVAEGLLAPLMAEWSSFRIAPTEFVSEGETVVSIGRFVGTHGATGKTADAGYAHVWTVRSGRIARFRQYIDTKAVADARI